jgi:hypothetical protein
VRKKPLERRPKKDDLEFRVAILEKNIQTMFDMMIQAGIVTDKPRAGGPIKKEAPKPAKRAVIGRAKKTDIDEARRSVEFLIHSAARRIHLRPGEPL